MMLCKIKAWIEDGLVYIGIGLGILVGGVAALAALMAALYLPIRQVDHHLNVAQCHTFSTVTGYQTKWVDYNFFDYGCLGRTSDGRWIPTDRLHDVNVEGK